MFGLDDVPDDIIRHILSFTSPTDTLRLERVSKRLAALTCEPLLWKRHCHTIRHWQHKRVWQDALSQPAAQVDWKRLWLGRRDQDQKFGEAFSALLSTRHKRMSRIELIVGKGFDAKDFLLAQLQVSDETPDCLASRYYAKLILDSIHRDVALMKWSTRFNGGETRLDRALAGFDMFFNRDTDYDVDYVISLLDNLANEFLVAYPKVEAKSSRTQALSLLIWTRERNLVGMDGEAEHYRDLRNCLLGQALLDEKHPSLPIVSVAIYVCLANRIGLSAFCCAFPSHVHAMICSKPGFDLDGNTTTSEQQDRMYLDPYGSENEIKLSDLRSRLVELQWSELSDTFLAPATPATIVVRLARNLSETYRNYHATHDEALVSLNGQPGTALTARKALYAAQWATLLTTPLTQEVWGGQLDSFLMGFHTDFPEDEYLVRKFLLPKYEQYLARNPQAAAGHSWGRVDKVLALRRNLDNRDVHVCRRYTEEIRRRVKYKIGQVFVHKRYKYVGIINGWGDRGTESIPGEHTLSAEEATSFVDGLDTWSADEGPVMSQKAQYHHVFYTCLRDTVDRHVVLQDNIVITTNHHLISEALMNVAGKFFKRFDAKTCTFVSNVRDIFPDD